jgi:hypothetical protein
LAKKIIRKKGFIFQIQLCSRHALGHWLRLATFGHTRRSRNQ